MYFSKNSIYGNIVLVVYNTQIIVENDLEILVSKLFPIFISYAPGVPKRSVESQHTKRMSEGKVYGECQEPG